MLKTSWQSFIHSLPEVTDSEPIKTSRKIRIYPNKKQKEFINKCFGTTRYLYNKALDYFKSIQEKEIQKQIKEARKSKCLHKEKQKRKYVKCENEPVVNEFLCEKHIKLKKYKIIPNISKIGIARNIVVKKKDLPKDEEWLNDIPYDTKTLAVRSFHDMYKSQKELLQMGFSKEFHLNYKSKKNNKQVCFIDHRTLKNNFHIFPRRFNKKIRQRKRSKKDYKKSLPKGTTEHDFIISRINGKYYCNFLIDNKEIKKTKKKDFVALDPGVRTFQTYYSSGGECGKYGEGFSNEIYKIATKVDSLQSRYDSYKNKKLMPKGKHLTRTLHNLRKKCSLLRTKIRNKVDDLHKKVSKSLCDKFKNIFLPYFDTTNMVKKLPEKMRKLNCKTVRNMLGLSQGRFREFIIRKAKMMGSKVWLCTEAYTSKTCTCCGKIYKIGGSETFSCSSCNFKMDRDIHGARNILLRVFTIINE